MNKIKITVTSDSFSFNPELTHRLKGLFPNSKFKANKNKFSKQELIDFLADSDGIIVGLETIDQEILDSLPNLKIVSKYGVGTDNLDLELLKSRNIQLGWTPGLNRTSVSELVIGQMIGMSRNLFKSCAELRNGQWIKDGGRELSELTVGVLGTGHIGKEVIKKLAAFDCKILAHDLLDMSSFYSDYKVQKASISEIFSASDIVTVHIPLNSQTKGLVGRELLSLMNERSMLVNTSRGGIVNEEELYQALSTSRIRAASSDVFESEPAIGHKLISLNNFFPSPHIAGNSHKAINLMGNSSIDHLAHFFKDLL